MASNVYGQIYGFTTVPVEVGVGATIATFVDVPQRAVDVKLKVTTLGSGATLTMVGCGSPGTTLSAAALDTALTTGYPLAANETDSWTGPARFYLACAAATCVVTMRYGLSRDQSSGN